ncbi:MAG TPA: preprotein translocase subunit SecG, partial [Solirubrobacteraceae bacterium]|nr:preprotein translocase subunit SecG [Solirubrobacteraceae bacterium]
MTFVLDIVQVFVSVMLIFLVLMHSGKDAGLSGFGVGGGGGGGTGSSP